MAWSYVKRAIAKHKLKFNLSFVEQETKKQIEAVTSSMFAKFVSRVITEEEKYRKATSLADEIEDEVAEEGSEEGE